MFFIEYIFWSVQRGLRRMLWALMMCSISRGITAQSQRCKSSSCQDFAKDLWQTFFTLSQKGVKFPSTLFLRRKEAKKQAWIETCSVFFNLCMQQILCMYGSIQSYLYSYIIQQYVVVPDAINPNFFISLMLYYIDIYLIDIYLNLQQSDVIYACICSFGSSMYLFN